MLFLIPVKFIPFHIYLINVINNNKYLIVMLENLWTSSHNTAKRLGINEKDLSYLREIGILKPGIHWKSSPFVQKKPWNPEAVYNYKLCQKITNEEYFLNQFDRYAA